MSLSLKNRKVKFSTKGLSPKSLAKIENPVITGLMNPVTAKLVKNVSFQKNWALCHNRVNEPHPNRVKNHFWHQVTTGLMNPVPTRLKEKVEHPLQQG